MIGFVWGLRSKKKRNIGRIRDHHSQEYVTGLIKRWKIL